MTYDPRYVILLRTMKIMRARALPHAAEVEIMPKFSVISVYSNVKDFRFTFLSTLKKQSIKDVQILEGNIKEKQYKSAAQAFNELLEQAEGDYVIIVPPLVKLYDEFCLEDIEKFCGDPAEFGVSGVVGVVTENGTRKVISNSAYGERTTAFGTMSDDVCEVDVVDPTLLVLSRTLIDKGIRFRDLGPTWSLYAEDISLQSKKAGLRVLYNPAQVIHLKPEKVTASYVNALKSLRDLEGGLGGSFSTALGKFGLSDNELLLRKLICIPETLFSIVMGFMEKVR